MCTRAGTRPAVSGPARLCAQQRRMYDRTQGNHQVKSLFTIHAGEFVAGDYIERTYRRVNVWVPVKDAGVDLLVSDGKNKRVVSLQVKFSRDFLATHMADVFQKPLRACGWWKLDRQKIAVSPADYWVFVLVGFERRSTDFVIITPAELLRRLDAVHHGNPKVFQSYLWVTKKRECWEARGLTRPDQLRIAQGQFKDVERNFSAYLNNWGPIKELDLMNP